MKKVICILISVLMIVITVGCSKSEERVDDIRKITDEQYSFFNLTGTDALGRKLSAGDNLRDSEIYVGMFYSLWLGQHKSLQTSVNCIQTLLDLGDEGMAKLNDTSDYGQFYFWGEPLYGFYNMQDPWIINKHVELLTMAGIDYLCIDATNTHDYIEVGTILLNTLLKYSEQGFDVPQICFYTNTNSGTTVNQIYKDYYAEHPEWADLWFAPNGRPLIIGITDNNHFASDQTKFYNTSDYISSSMQRYFEVRESEWPNGEYNENSIPWMSWDNPQKIHNGSIAVPVAQHSHSVISVSSQHPECSRAYNNVTKIKETDWMAGKSFETMWDTVFDNLSEVNNVLVCSWNEWQAQHLGANEFVDVYNNEYSRDIEMMKNGYGDNFYLQLMENVRAYKLTTANRYKLPTATINFSDNNYDSWSKATAIYKDFAGDAMARDFYNSAWTEKYVDNSNRNDIKTIKVINDGENIYFYVETVDNITAYNGGLNWMNILISTDSSDTNSFSGYKYIVNRNPSGKTTSVEKSSGGYNWTSSGDATYTVSGNVMQVAVPLSALGLTKDNCYIEFKVADNVTNYSDIMDYYVTGDCAPIGRLSYAYGY
jgi:hypothetical protein